MSTSVHSLFPLKVQLKCVFMDHFISFTFALLVIISLCSGNIFIYSKINEGVFSFDCSNQTQTISISFNTETRQF